ncbi:MAG: amino acid permease [Verrucomicrobiales bacterium]|nr:amino acid permease [Verrucomicrobiales bacterium]
MPETSEPQETPRLQPRLGVFGAMMMGLGSIVGTGVFVSIGIAAGIAGPSVILAVALAALVAICNGLSSAQLAANHPMSGGTYEYGYQYLNSWLGFTAGWMFLLAKSASAATAALGFSGYLLSAMGGSSSFEKPVALAAVGVLTLFVLGGIHRSHVVNVVIVSATLFALAFFVATGLPMISRENLTPFFPIDRDEGAPLAALFHATALMFVAYTGYGRIATLGEEVREPHRTIPKAIILTLLVSMVLYLAVAIVGVGAVGSGLLSSGGDGATGAQPAPLAVAALQFRFPLSSQIVAIGAITAMLGVLLNLILGLSRVLLAMGRRRDMPGFFAALNPSKTTPVSSVVMMGAAIAGLVLIGNVKTTWSFSAFTVLLYYAITNLAALRIPQQKRLYPAWIAGFGVIFCLFLAFWVERETWLVGLGLVLLGLCWHAIAKWRRKSP